MLWIIEVKPSERLHVVLMMKGWNIHVLYITSDALSVILSVKSTTVLSIPLFNTVRVLVICQQIHDIVAAGYHVFSENFMRWFCYKCLKRDFWNWFIEFIKGRSKSLDINHHFYTNIIVNCVWFVWNWGIVLCLHWCYFHSLQESNRVWKKQNWCVSDKNT